MRGLGELCVYVAEMMSKALQNVSSNGRINP